VYAGTINTVYLAAGSGQPVVLLHGALAAGITWYPVIGPLAAHFGVIAPDIVGYGQSDKPPGRYDRAYYCAWLADFLDALGVEKAHLVGHSQGGAIGLQFALDHPARVDRLVLVDSAGLGNGVPLGVILAMLCYNLFPSPATGLWLSRYAVRSPRSIDPALGEYMIQVTRASGGRRSLLRSRTHTRFGARKLGQITQQTLIIWGRDDRFVPVAQAGAAAEAMPHAELHVIPEAGHVPFFDQPQAFNDALIRFLKGEGIR
jgi:4,5:9,10-diseco-3-hydroxy-5,9,17-trioxoandrosta-1(10),2-diene-4-oate hydrolase